MLNPREKGWLASQMTLMVVSLCLMLPCALFNVPFSFGLFLILVAISIVAAVVVGLIVTKKLEGNDHD